MMDRVNLLPDEARLGPVERLVRFIDRQFWRVLAGVVGFLVVAGLLLMIVQEVRWRGSQKRLRELKTQIQTLQVETQNMESFAKQLDQVEQELGRQKKVLEWKINYLEATKTRPRIWASRLKELRQNIPHGVWLSELETGRGKSLRVAGGAREEELVTQFMGNLKSSPHFANVGFTYTEKDTIGNVPIVKFEIVCQVN